MSMNEPNSNRAHKLPQGTPTALIAVTVGTVAATSVVFVRRFAKRVVKPADVDRRRWRAVGKGIYGLAGLVPQVLDAWASPVTDRVRRWLTVDDRDHRALPSA